MQTLMLSAIKQSLSSHRICNMTFNPLNVMSLVYSLHIQWTIAVYLKIARV